MIPWIIFDNWHLLHTTVNCKWILTFHKLTRAGFIWRIMAWVIPWTTLRCSLRLRFPLLNRFPQTWQTAGGSCTPLWNCLKWDLAFPFWVNSLAHIRHLNFWPSSRGASHWLKCWSTSPFPFPLLTGTEISDLTTWKLLKIWWVFMKPKRVLSCHNLTTILNC